MLAGLENWPDAAEAIQMGLVSFPFLSGRRHILLTLYL